MKRKYIALVVLLCVILVLLILSISNLKNKESNDVSNKNDDNSVTLDDLSEDENDSAKGELDPWSEPAASKDEKEVEDGNSHKVEADNKTDSKEEHNEENNVIEDEDKEEKKQEWIGGDF